MDDRARRIAQTMEFVGVLRGHLLAALDPIMEKVRPDNDDVGIAVAAYIQVFFDLAFTMSQAGGMGPGDFTNAIRLLANHVEATFGNETLGEVAVGSAPEAAPTAGGLDIQTLWKRGV